MRYPVIIPKRAAIPPNIGIKVRMRNTVKPGGEGPGKCVPQFAGYAVSGDLTYDPSAGVWRWPCIPWAGLITGFGIPCGKPYSWRFETGQFFLGTPPVATEGVDAFGNPTLAISGDGTGCDDDPGGIVTAALQLGGQTFGGDVDLRKAQPPFALSFDSFQNPDTGALSWSLSSSGTTIFMLTNLFDGSIEVWLRADNSPNTLLNWTIDQTGTTPDYTVTVLQQDTNTPGVLKLGIQCVNGVSPVLQISVTADDTIGDLTQTWTIQDH